MTKQMWQIQGSARNPYEILLHTDNHMSCNCPAWINKAGGTRYCKHVKVIVGRERFAVTLRDGVVFVIGSLDPNVALAGISGTTAGPLPAVAAPVAAPIATTLRQGQQAAFPKKAGWAITTQEADDAIIVPDDLPVAPKGFIEPMLASKMPDGKTVDSYDPDKYVMEEKYDGHRLIVRVDGSTVQAWSARLQNPRSLPDKIVDTLKQMTDGVYDGELMVPGMKSYDVTAGANAGNEVLALFDMIEADGTRLGGTQEERRLSLTVAHKPVKTSKVVVLSKQIPLSMKTVKEIWARGGEGAIIKAKDSVYRPNVRTPDWVKVKQVNHATLVVTGFKDGKSGPYSTINLRDDQGNDTAVKTLDNKTLSLIAKNPTGWIGRRLVIEYQERTPSGNYRHPMFDHIAGEAE